MKTEEQIAKAIEKSFSKECKGISITRSEFIRNNIAAPLEKFFDSTIGKYRTNLNAKEASEISATQNAYMNKFNANVDFRNASADYLLDTSIGSMQRGVLQQAIFKYADLKEDTEFLQWVFSNHKLESVSAVCTDTTTRLNSFLTNLYKDYVSGKKEANKKKEAAKAAKAEAKAAAEAINVMSDDELDKKLAEFLAEKKKREEKKITK